MPIIKSIDEELIKETLRRYHEEKGYYSTCAHANPRSTTLCEKFENTMSRCSQCSEHKLNYEPKLD